MAGRLTALYFIDEHHCPQCEQARIYYDYDAFSCAYCNTWLESTCREPTCGYWPEKPLNGCRIYIIVRVKMIVTGVACVGHVRRSFEL